MAYVEIIKKRNKKYFYLTKNLRLGKDKWKKIRLYLGSKKPSAREIKKASKKLEEEIKDYLHLIDPLYDLLSPNQIKELAVIKKAYNQWISKTSVLEKENYDEWFLTEFTYNSNAIEGSTLTLRETALVLFEKIAPAGRTFREIREADNHKAAFDYLFKYKGDIDKEFVCKLHHLLFHNTLSENAGVFRKVQVWIRGAPIIPPKPKEVEKEFKKLLRWYKKNKAKYHPVAIASYMHTSFESVHPFIDGNGRVGRLLLNFILLKNKFPMVNIKNKERFRYYEAIRKAQEGNLKPFADIVIKGIKEQFSTIIGAENRKK